MVVLVCVFAGDLPMMTSFPSTASRRVVSRAVMRLVKGMLKVSSFFWMTDFLDGGERRETFEKPLRLEANWSTDTGEDMSERGMVEGGRRG